MFAVTQFIKYLIAIFVVAILGGVASYFFFIRSQKISTPTVTSTEIDSTSPDTSAPLPAPVDTARDSTIGAPSTTQKPSRLWRASLGPIAGYKFAQNNATSTTRLLFVERSTGNVFEFEPETAHTLRLTNTLIPKTYEAQFGTTDGVVALRTLQDNSITTLLGSFNTSEATSTLPGSLGGPSLPTDILSIAFGGDDKSALMFYIVNTSTGVVGTLDTISPSKPRQIFSSGLKSWRAYLAGTTPVVLTSPSDGLAGYAYSITSTGAKSLLVGPIPGLQILPNASTKALVYSSSIQGQNTLYVRVGTDAPKTLSLKTIAEKCVWAIDARLIIYCAVPDKTPESNFLDLWYQGAAHTSDSFWQIDVESGEVKQIYTPATPIDAHELRIDPSGNYLAFANGVDMSLWILKIVP